MTENPPAPLKPENTAFDLKFGSIWAVSAMLDLLLPPACRLCHEPVQQGHDFCHSCWLALSLSDPTMRSACRRCGRPGGLANKVSGETAGAPPKTEIADLVDDGVAGTFLTAEAAPACVHCKAEHFHFDQVVAKWTYQGRVCDAIVAAKHSGHAALGNALGRQLGERVLLDTAMDPPDLITYVPSHFLRQWSRGGRSGNVAIAEAVSESLRRTMPTIALKPRLRATRRIKKQAWLGDVERRKNVSGAFAAKKGYAWPRKLLNLGATNAGPFDIKDQHILVIDDVLTTGATANEVAKVLREAGARRVTLAVVARAVWSK